MELNSVGHHVPLRFLVAAQTWTVEALTARVPAHTPEGLPLLCTETLVRW